MTATNIRILTTTFEDDSFTFQFDDSVLLPIGNTTFEYLRVTEVSDPEEPENLGYIRTLPGASDESLCRDAYDLWLDSCHVQVGC